MAYAIEFSTPDYIWIVAQSTNIKNKLSPVPFLSLYFNKKKNVLHFNK